MYMLPHFHMYSCFGHNCAKICCDGICRFSCTCTSCIDCDWNEKCCSDHQYVDGFDLCSEPLPVYFITVGVCSMAFITFVCLMIICCWARHWAPYMFIQLFRQRLFKLKSVKAYVILPKGSLGNTQ